MNVRLLRKIEKYILEEPKRFNMRQWGAVFNPESELSKAEAMGFLNSGMNGEDRIKIKSSELPPCGTIGCIAGTAYVLSLPGEMENLREDMAESYGAYVAIPGGVEEIAAYHLGLNEYERARLFYIKELYPSSDSGWPQKFANRYLKAKTPATRAKVAVARIEHFIATKGRE